MRKLLAVAVLTASFSTSGLAAEMTGYISDESCAKTSAKATKAADWVKPDAFEACVKKCLKEGSTAVFVTEDNKILRLDAASSAKAMALVGHHVKVTGTAANGTLTVDSISPIAMTPKPAAAAPAGQPANR